jgi:SAM-dependent methyltransferase
MPTETPESSTATPQATCPLCGSDQSRAAFSERGYRLLQCGECELFYIDPYPSQAQETYDTVHDYAYQDLEILDCQRHYKSSCTFYNQYFPRIAEELRGMKSLLDVGCGTGRLLELVGQEFPQIQREGLELNATRAAYARQLAGCPVHEIPLERFEVDQPFDVICLMNVLSHVPQIRPLFDALRQRMRPQGKLVLKVGELSSEVRKSAFYDWNIPDHLHFLGLKTLDKLAQNLGWSVLRHDRVPLSSEMFSRPRWLSPGRSRVRNSVKRVVAHSPGALATMRWTYRRLQGDSVYSSLVVLTPK